MGTIGHEIKTEKVSQSIWHKIENDKIIHPLDGDQELDERGLGYVAP